MKPDGSQQYDWTQNRFRQDIGERLARTEQVFSHERLVYARDRGAWSQRSVATGASRVGMLQNPSAVVDVTDHGLGIYPLGLDGRYFLRVGFHVHDGSQGWSTNWESFLHDDAVTDRRILFEPGRVILEGRIAHRGYAVHIAMARSHPFVCIDLVLTGYAPGQQVCVTPILDWMPGESSILSDPAGVWLMPRSVPLVDPVIAKNNSILADPHRPADAGRAGLGITLASLLPAGTSSGPCSERSTPETILADRAFATTSVERTTLPTVTCTASSAHAQVSVMLGICETRETYAELLRARSGRDSLGPVAERSYWPEVLSRLSVQCPDAAINRQIPYSIHNSLFSRSRTGTGQTLFIHGRRDRGYEDCAKIHQSYQMHFVALAAGETESVAQELRAFAEVQDEHGALLTQLRPGKGTHPYAGQYSNANFILAVHRYLSWTGDFGFLDEEIGGDADQAGTRTILECTRLAAEWLLANRWEQLIAPCGWCDGWPPDVRAQGQVSAVSYLALRRLSAILGLGGFRTEAQHYDREATALGRQMHAVLYDSTTGLFAEHVYDSGYIAGGQPEDFWVHTQVWCALADLAPDSRGLELCRLTCLEAGMPMVTELSAFSDYIGRSTDGYADLSIESTLTWVRAAWPELTHLYALAELHYGRPDAALDALLRQLPEHLMTRNPRIVPFYYAEKYLNPSVVPWLCTWGGDPSLIEVLLEGFLGINADLEGLRITPRLPASWQDAGKVQADFVYRGQRWHLAVEGRGTSVRSLVVDDLAVPPDKRVGTAPAHSGEHVIHATLGD